jgi:hypothetical protein
MLLPYLVCPWHFSFCTALPCLALPYLFLPYPVLSHPAAAESGLSLLSSKSLLWAFLMGCYEIMSFIILMLTRFSNFRRNWVMLVKRRDIGAVGYPDEFNLRELTKLRDVLLGNAVDLKHELISGDRSAGSEEEARTAIVSRCAELVYARTFSSQTDWV